MKKFIVLLLVAFISITIFAYAEVKKEQEFKVTYAITYNNITLEEAARLEMVIKEKFKDACKIEVDVKKEAEDNPIFMLMND